MILGGWPRHTSGHSLSSDCRTSKASLGHQGGRERGGEEGGRGGREGGREGEEGGRERREGGRE